MDLDGDGARDVITGSWPGELYWFRGTGKGDFSKAEQLKDGRGKVLNLGNASTAFAADWDGDGDLDLLVGDIDGVVHLVPNASGGKALDFGAAQRVRVGGLPFKVDGDSAPILADWDADGRQDLVVGSGDGRVIWCRDLSKDGVPLWGPVRELLPASSMWRDDAGAKTAWGVRTKPCVADWDRDGKPDLLVGDFATEETPPHALSPEDTARRDRLLAERDAVSRERTDRYRKAAAVVGRDMGLDFVEGEPQPPKDKARHTEFHQRILERFEADEPGWHQANIERQQALWQELQPLQGESRTHGHVWFFRRR